MIPQFDSPTQFMTSPQGSDKDEPNTDRDDTGELVSEASWEVKNINVSIPHIKQLRVKFVAESQLCFKCVTSRRNTIYMDDL